METLTKKKLYEAMFLVDSADAGSDWDGVIAAITKILNRAEVEIVSIKKWDDRRLAYEIKGKSRGTYLLCYFRSDGRKNQEIEKAVQISERIIRVLILCADWMTDEDIQKDTPATKAEKEKEERETPADTDEEQEDFEEEAEETDEIETEDESSPAEAVALTDDALPAEEAVEEPEDLPANEEDEEETDDSQQKEPKAAADE